MEGGGLRRRLARLSLLSGSSSKPDAINKTDQQPRDCAAGGVHCHGVLLKKVRPKNRTSRWVRRFCILREGFLLFYNEGEAVEFERKQRINRRPRSILSLGGCSVESFLSEFKFQYGIKILAEELHAPLLLTTATPLERDKWLAAFRDATRLTLKNAQLGETMIRDLESQGLRLTMEKQEFVDKFQVEASALREQVDKNTELERIKLELQMEHDKLERTTAELKADLDKVKQELSLMTQMKQTLEQEKLNLFAKNNHLISSLESFELEKQKIEEQLAKNCVERDIVLAENHSLSKTTGQLQSELEYIESQTTALMEEKQEVQQRLVVNERKTKSLAEEKETISKQAKQLISSINDLNVQKEMTENDLREEVTARLAAERQLQAAEKALEHLENALKLSGAQINELKDQIMPDVRNLKRFFEEAAEEARLDADRPLIMQNAVYARKSFIRKSLNRKLRNSMRNKQRRSPHTELEVPQPLVANTLL